MFKRDTWGAPHALCRDVACAWKFFGSGWGAAEERAEAHIRETGHSVRLYGHQTTRDIDPSPAVLNAESRKGASA